MNTLYGNSIKYLYQERCEWGGQGYGIPTHYRYSLLDSAKVTSGLSIQLTAEQAFQFAANNSLEILKHLE